jgi:hypothetical protein
MSFSNFATVVVYRVIRHRQEPIPNLFSVLYHNRSAPFSIRSIVSSMIIVFGPLFLVSRKPVWRSNSSGRSIRHVVEPSRSGTQRSRSTIPEVDGWRIGPSVSTALRLLLLLLPLQVWTLGVAGAIALLRIVNVLVLILRWGLRLLLQVCPSCPAQRLQIQRLSSGRRDSQSLRESFGLSDFLWDALERRGLLASERCARIQHLIRLVMRSKITHVASSFHPIHRHRRVQRSGLAVFHSLPEVSVFILDRRFRSSP